MNAQELIDISNDTSEETFKMFYPTLYSQKQADENISKILRNLA